MAKRTIRSRLKPKPAHDRTSPQAKLWVAALSAMGNERWQEAIVRFQNMLSPTSDPEIHQGAYSNLAFCYLELGNYDQAPS